MLLILLLVSMRTYRGLETQRRELLELKNEYDSYVLMYKKIFDEYRSFKDGGSAALQGAVTEQVAVFEPVNRDAAYLTESAVDFGKHYNLEDSMRFLYGLDGAHYEAPRASIKKRKRPIRIAHNRKLKPSGWVRGYQQMRRSDVNFSWPIDRDLFWLSSRFGPRKTDGEWQFHYGADFAALAGTPVKAAAAGVVIEVSYSKKGYGNTIVLAHAGDRTSRYAHLQKIDVRYGQKIMQGQLIGQVGATGLVRGKNGKKSASHLHFEVKEHGKHIDPLLVLA